jgi:hypothetical protein
VLAFTFDAIINLRSRVARRRYARDILNDKVPLHEVVVDFDAEQRRAHAEQRLLEEPLLVRLRSVSSRKLQIGPGDDLEADMRSEYPTLAVTTAPSAMLGAPPRRQEKQHFDEVRAARVSSTAQPHPAVRTPLRDRESEASKDDAAGQATKPDEQKDSDSAPACDEEGGLFACRYDDAENSRKASLEPGRVHTPTAG